MPILSNKRVNLKKDVDDKELLKKYQSISKLNKEELLTKYKSNIEGLPKKERHTRLEKNGKNIVVEDIERTPLYFLINSFKDQFIIILIVLAIVNLILGDKIGTFIIIAIAFVSAFIRYKQDYSVYKFNRKLKSEVTSTTNIIIDKVESTSKVDDVVEGDIILVNAGSIIPADCIVLDSKDLFINNSVFTGESVPVEKTNKYLKEQEIFSISNICLMGSSVISGNAKLMVISTGFNTYLGKIGKDIDTTHIETNFEKGINSITRMLIKYMIIVSIVVFFVHGILRNNMVEAVLYALSVAVGITPSMLPMIVNVNLTKGSRELSKRKVLVKKIDSIQNLGAIDILCTDKTGTLTKDNITLQKYIDIDGNEDISILEYAYLNSMYATGIKNLVDRAIISYGNSHNITSTLEKYEKIDEIPFDYERRKMSIVVKSKNNTTYRMITKGALEDVLKSCTKVKDKNSIKPITKDIVKKINENAKRLAESGMQVIALASKRTKDDTLKAEDEVNMTFVGYVAFLDPAKEDVKNTLKSLYEKGVKTKILTGDNPYATKNICSIVGLNSTEIILGSELDLLSDEELSKKIEEVDVFARVNPLQKERIVKAYKNNGHVVGYMGDGVNDAPSLHAADVGISVNTATDIAKESSDIILLEKSLDVIYNGVIEGRIVYGNIIKYMKMALSADFGDVFSVMIASIFLPFLPLLPIQMLIQDFLYDFSQIAIPYDNVDKEFLKKPKKWDTSSLSRFMNIMGITSSIIDVLAFIIFWFILGYNSVDKQAYFQTAWFVECLISETLIIHYVRTSKMPFVESNANWYLTLMSSITIVGTILTPILLHNIKSFNFVILPFKYYVFVLILIIMYSILVEIIKYFYIKRYKEWL